MVVISTLDRGLGRVVLASIARRGKKPRRRAIDAQVVGGREIDEVLGIEGAAEMIVQMESK